MESIIDNVTMIIDIFLQFEMARYCIQWLAYMYIDSQLPE